MTCLQCTVCACAFLYIVYISHPRATEPTSAYIYRRCPQNICLMLMSTHQGLNKKYYQSINKSNYKPDKGRSFWGGLGGVAIICKYIYIYIYICIYIYVFPTIEYPPKWMVSNGNPYYNGWFGGTTIYGNTHIYTCIDDITNEYKLGCPPLPTKTVTIITKWWRLVPSNRKHPKQPPSFWVQIWGLQNFRYMHIYIYICIYANIGWFICAIYMYNS